ncbi:hypothetical protein C9890_0497 [Perkinsus sp. BL_2016]|nr:hypothetical protein C9890_0497 [Perkinsus sp. BL_2016]
MFILPLLDKHPDYIFYQSFSILRLFHAGSFIGEFKLHPAIRQLWLLMKGVTDSLVILFWTIVTVFFLSYIYGLIGMKYIAVHEGTESQVHASREYFGNVLTSAFSMFQVMTVDTWADGIARPVGLHKSWFFVSFVALTLFVLTNLVTSLVVSNAFRSAAAETAEVKAAADEARRREVIELHALFKEMDSDKSGFIDQKEFESAVRSSVIARKFEALGFEDEDLVELWQLLDDGDGRLTIDEFIGAIRKMKEPPSASDVFDLLRRVRSLLGYIMELSKLSEEVELDLWHSAAQVNLTREGIRGLKEASAEMRLRWLKKN